MGDTVLFHMWSTFRELQIEQHKFYVDQARTRLLTQFENIEAEADKAAEDWLERNCHNFNSDYHDPADHFEAAQGESQAFYMLLTQMRNNTRLSVVAGMYHEWDKQLRDWMISETQHWYDGTEMRKAIWRVNFPDLVAPIKTNGHQLIQKFELTQFFISTIVANTNNFLS